MKRENPFRISALNSLQVHEVQIKHQKQLMNTFKGANDLRKQLNKNKNSSLSAYKQSLQSNTKQFSSTMVLQKPVHEVLFDEVAALDNFKPAVTRQKTKNMIENIKLRRRQKHIQAYNNFKQDLDDYKQNLLSIYESLYNDCNQVLSIKQSQLSGYYNSQTDEYLLSREREILEEFDLEIQMYQSTTMDKLTATKQELQRIKGSRGTVVDQTCQMLRLELIQIAFVLENEARQIEQKEKEEMSALEEKFYQQYKQQILTLQSKQSEQAEALLQKKYQVKDKWKQLKQEFQTKQFINLMSSQLYTNPKKRQSNYTSLIALQEQTHAKKRKNLESLIVNQHVDSLRKVNTQKWYEVIKAINEQFDKKLDQIVKELMAEFNISKANNLNLLQHLDKRLKYIQNHTAEEIAQMLATKYTPIVEKNNLDTQELIKKATTYVQLNDDKENQLLENLFKFFSSISQNNDDFIKQFAAQSQKYEIQKAKILDDDEQNIEKLQKQLLNLKQELKQSLHHIKLEEVEKKCFEKIDQMEQAYRKTHEQNKQLAASRPKSLNDFIQKYEQKMAAIFQLYEATKRAELIERNKQQAQKQALRIIDEQDKKKLEEEQKQAELIRKNGGKAPPAAKPKDPKKLAAQIQQRKKAILAQMGQKKIQELKTGSGNTWLVYRGLQDISKQFYKSTSLQVNQLKQAPQQTNVIEPLRVVRIDQLQDPIVNGNGQKITTNQTFFKITEIAQFLLKLRDNIFSNIDTKKNRILSESSNNDSEMMQQSLMTLDQRLKRHYSLKGQLQAEIYLKRSGEITGHKKRYQKYARTVRDKMDLQTQRFNFLLQKSLQQLKIHNSQQKKTREQLSSGKSLSQLQGLLSKARENYNKFSHEINQIVAELNHLAKTQIEILLQKNAVYIKQSRLMKDGGDYSEEQIKWYQDMMKQITDQIKAQQTKRQEKTKEIHDQSDKRKKQLLEKFQKQYQASIDELSAKDGTGKAYGKPKRIAQQKTRLQMNKCEQAQIKINKQIEDLAQIYFKQKSKDFRFQQRPQSLVWRRKLMTVFTCIQRYARHLQALKKDLKIKPMLRVNYDESLPECNATSQQEDKKLMQEQISEIGSLGEQKQEKPFMKFILDIQKIISDQSRTIYVGDKAKYLTGNDKIPQFLRRYIATMKQSAQDFRQNSNRQLRQSCARLSDLCQNFSQLFICSIKSFFISSGDQNYSKLSKQFSEMYNRHQKQKTQNLRLLRPNLSNPKCQGDLTILNEKELIRQKQFVQSLNLLKQNFKSTHFSNGSTFINCLINNYEFLVQYCDSLYLFEDFIKVVGGNCLFKVDDDQEKKKLNIKKLMVMKQKGINIDSSSERNLKKKWEGVNFTIINFDDKKFNYKKVQVEQANSKDNKKAAKKDAKKPANQQPAVTQNESNSKQIQTFKTWRQKSVFQWRQRCIQQFHKRYSQIISEMYARIDQGHKQNQMFNKKWTNIAKQLFLK